MYYKHKILSDRTAEKIGKEWIIRTGKNHFKDIIIPHALLKNSNDWQKVETLWTYNLLEELQKRIISAQNNSEIWTAIWSIYDYISVQEQQLKETLKTLSD